MQGTDYIIPGLRVLFSTADHEISETLIHRFASLPSTCNLKCRDFTPIPNLFVRNVFHPFMSAIAEVVHSPLEEVAIVFHGEIYNCRELAGHLGLERANAKSISDSARIVAEGIEKEGLGFIEKMNGSFLLLAYFRKDKKIYLANDRYGLRQHCYAWERNVLYVAPTPSNITRCWNGEPRLDPQGTVELLAFEHLLGNKTLVKNVNVIPPASIIRFDSGLWNVDQYWDFPYSDSYSKSTERNLQEEFNHRVTIAVRRQLPSSGRLGIPLSGGLDSRLLAGVTSQYLADLQTFTYGTPGSMDRRFAHEVAKKLGAQEYCAVPEGVLWNDHFTQFARTVDGMMPVIHGHMLLLETLLQSHADVVLTGTGGDVLSGRPLPPLPMANRPINRNLEAWLLRRYFKAFTAREIRRLFSDGEIRQATLGLEQPLRRRIGDCTSRIFGNCADYVGFKERQRRFIGSGVNAMRSYVEVRNPYYDYDLVDFAVSLPLALRSGQRLYKNCIWELCPLLRDIGHTPHGRTIRENPGRYQANTLSQFMPYYLKKLVPSTLKKTIRGHFQLKAGNKSEIPTVNYITIFSDHLNHDWRRCSRDSKGAIDVAAGDMIYDVFQQLCRKKGKTELVKLSTWLTLQLYLSMMKTG